MSLMHISPLAQKKAPKYRVSERLTVSKLARRVMSSWMNDKCVKLAAALACYAVLSLAPLIVILFKLVSLVVHGDHARQLITGHLQSLLGNAANNELIDAILQSTRDGSGILATSISIVVLLFGASGVFGELQDSLNHIWQVKGKSKGGIVQWLRDRFVSMSMVLGLGFLLLVSFFVSTLLTMFSHSFLSDAKIVGFATDVILSIIVITAMIAMIYKWLPDVVIQWRDVWLGAFITALLFIAGKWTLTLYFQFAAPTSAFGAFGSLAAVVIWVYYASQILFLGAEFTKVYAKSRGHIFTTRDQDDFQKGTVSDAKTS